MQILLKEIFEIYIQTLEGLKQQHPTGKFDEFERTYPRDPLFIATGLEAVYGIEISVAFVDFYKDLDDIPPDQRDFISFYEYVDPNQVVVYINKHKIEGEAGSLVSKQTARFVLLKEIFNAVIRRTLLTKGRDYPDTVEFGEFMSAHLDWISEKFSVYDFEEDEYSATVSVENAAEVLALLFLVNISELYTARKRLGIKPKKFWKLKNNNSGDDEETKAADIKFSLFEYDKYAKEYDIKVRFIIVLIKTDFILKIVDGIKNIVSDIKSIFSTLDDNGHDKE